MVLAIRPRHTYTIKFQLYSCSFRRMRRAAHEALTKRAVQKYYPIQTKEATTLALSLISSSANVDLPKRFHRTGASTIMSIVYDYPTLESINDPAVKYIEEFMLRISNAMTPGRFLVDIFPWMMYIPERSWIFVMIPICMLTYDPQKVCEMEAGRLETIYR
jgi:hypothetical protein